MPFEEDIKKLSADPTLGVSGNVGRTPGGFANVITGESLTPIQPPVITPSQPSSIPSPNDITITELAPKTPETAEPFLKQIESLQKDILGGEAAKQAEISAATADFSSQIRDINKQIRAHQLRAMQAEEEASQRGETLGFASGEAARVRREASFEAFRLASLSEALQGNLLSATKLAETSAEQKFAEKKKQLFEARQRIIQNYDNMTPEQRKRADATLLAIDKEDSFVKNAEEKQKEAQKKTLEYVGIATPLVLDEMSKAKTAVEVGQIANKYGLKTLAERKAEKEIASFGESTDIKEFRQFFPNVDITTPAGRQAFLNFEAQKAATKRKAEEAPSPALSGKFGNVIKAASNILPSERMKASQIALSDAIQQGDYGSAYAQIANNVESVLTGEVKTKFANSRNDYLIMLGMKEAIEKYAAGGGDLGLLTGKVEDIKRKLGIDSGKASALAVQLWREFQTYRLNMTGAAFSEAESKDYASVNPSLGKSLNLNLSVIDGALAQLENRITSTINTRVPNAKKIYSLISGAEKEEIDPAKATIGTIIELGGKRYKKVGDNQFQEL